MSDTLHINDEPYTYDAEAEAGIYLSTGERWWGSRVKWRKGTAGRWNRLILEGVHPMDNVSVRHGLRFAIERTLSHTPEAHTP